MKHKRKKQYRLERTFLSTWWTVAFLLLTAATYERAIHHTHKKIKHLQEKKEQLLTKRIDALLDQEDLINQLQSFSDPKWLELILMKGLGVAPEDYKKVYFKRETPE